MTITSERPFALVAFAVESVPPAVSYFQTPVLNWDAEINLLTYLQTMAIFGPLDSVIRPLGSAPTPARTAQLSFQTEFTAHVWQDKSSLYPPINVDVQPIISLLIRLLEQI